jgi:voltage-dependent potassium channel beta subunit
MEYRMMGPTGLRISAIGYGNWLNSNDPKQEEVTFETLKKAWECGVNFFDTAEGYAGGQAEIAMGKAFKKIGMKREDIVISTKLFWGPVGGENKMGLSRKRVIEGTNNSLKRLQVDYVDIIFCHRYDEDTPLEETCRALNRVIEDGKALYWGTSEWSSQQIASAIEICDRLKLHRPVVEQPQYNMFHRQKFEAEYIPIFKNYGLGPTIWSPLAGGLLTGKFVSQEAVGGRFATLPPYVKNLLHYDEYFHESKIDKTTAMFKGFEEIAKSLGATVPQLALAWVLRNKNVTSALCGFTKVNQVEENIKALEIYKKFTSEIDEKLEKLLDNRPKIDGYNPRTSAAWAPSR